ncbi:MAG TPA: FG-GAP-like repeat-containing protein [Candidatus Acidoferrales bacterium]|nr:FG-GAP-like repeat-containing protein [Candidatus Acidoferrales bacterium]
MTLTSALLSAAQQHKRPRPFKPLEPAAIPTLSAQQVEAIRQNNIGRALMERQHFEDALGKFQTACIMDPDSEVGCMNMGIALLYMQHYEDARRVLVKSTSRQAQSPVPWFNLGLLEKTVGQTGLALKDFEKAASLDPDDADTQYFLGALYASDRQYPKAIAAYKKAVQLNPFHASAELGLAEVAQQTNDIDAALAHLNRFRHITSDNLGEPVSVSYGEQGKYSRVQELPWAPEPPGPAVPVHFVDVTANAGLNPVPRISRGRGKTDETARPSAESGSLANFLGSGACIFDYNGDGKPDIFFVNFEGKGDSALFKNIGEGKFVNETKNAKLDFHGEGTSCAFGDYDNDGHLDLVIGTASGVRLYHNEGNGTFKDVTSSAGIECDGLVLGISFIDYDRDGDLDLYVTRFADFPLDNPEQPFAFPQNAHALGNILWRNKGDGTFMDWTAHLGLTGNAPSIGTLVVDLNNDRAEDLVLSGLNSPAIMMNSHEGVFQSISPWATEMPNLPAGITALDFDKDGWMDLAFTHWAPPGISLWRNTSSKSFQRAPLPDPGWMRGWGITPLDYDNDGWVDLVAVGETFSGEGRILLLRNEGLKGFRDVTQETGLDKIVLHNPRSVIAFDSDGNGSADLLVTQNNLPPLLLKNVGGNKNGWVEVAFRSESGGKNGFGNRVDMFAGGQRQSWELVGASGYLSQGPPEILQGMGSLAQADVVRIVWPSGTLQNELQVPGLRRDVISEFDPRDAH